MAQEVGTMFWEMRAASGLSLGKLALRAGVSKSALSQWETGARKPRAVELQAVLDALGVSDGQRTLIFSHIDAPRANRYLRQKNTEPGIGAPPMMSELLRALRLRKGWTQAQTAFSLGVGDSTIARWECGERQISTEQVQALCCVLEARDEEIVALTTGAFGEPYLSEGATWALAEPVLRHRLEDTRDGGSSGLEDLHFFALRRVVWKWAAQEAGARHLLAETYTYQAQFARNHERWTETQALAHRVTAMMPEKEQRPAVLLRAVILSAAAAVYGGNRPTSERGIHLLKSWRERSQLPEYTAWILSEMAHYAIMAGHIESGLRWSQEACRMATEYAHPVEVYLRKYDYGKLLTQAGRPAEALRVLPAPVANLVTDRAKVMLAHAEAHRQIGNLCEAHDWLQQAYPLIESHDMKLLRLDADALSAQL